MGQNVKVMTWNIAEGSLNKQYDDDSMLDPISKNINQLSPDIVLINEVKFWKSWMIFSGTNQAEAIAKKTNMPYFHWSESVATGTTGHKGVAVLSKFRLGEMVEHAIEVDGASRFTILETTAKIGELQHHIFSLRFSPIHADFPNKDKEWASNELGHSILLDRITSIRRDVPIICGGDFNNNQESDAFGNFSRNSGLINAMGDDAATVDHMFFRGPYALASVSRIEPERNPSDHPYVFVELTNIELATCSNIRRDILSVSEKMDKITMVDNTPLGPNDHEDAKINAQIAKIEAKKNEDELNKLKNERNNLIRKAKDNGCWDYDK